MATDTLTAPADAGDETADRIVPPFWLRRVRIENYKSIAFCDVTLEPLTLFVGPNGAGKSNFLDAIAFAQTLISRGLTDAIEQHGGAAGIRTRGATSPRTVIELEAELRPSAEVVDRATWAAEIRWDDAGRAALVGERLRIDADGSVHGFDVAGGAVTVLESGQPSAGLFPAPAGDRAYLSAFDRPPFGRAADRFRSMFVYNFNPPLIRATRRLAPAAVLDRDGRNLADILLALRSADPSGFEQVESALSSIVRTVARVEPKRYGVDITDIEFLIEPTADWIAPGPGGKRFGTGQVSDGTLRALAALTAAYQVKPPAAPGRRPARPALIGIDEPETSLHPLAAYALLAALNGATGCTQVLLTTHTAEWLDEPLVDPDGVRVVKSEDGETIIGPMDAVSRSAARDRLDTLARMHEYNQIDPDFDDRDRQQALRGAVTGGALAAGAS